tara:strand:+ start:200 stop:343 length:144 start_codon:yes stop_codon:yes gene_type:complete
MEMSWKAVLKDKTNTEDPEKMAGAVSTTSSPALFNVKYSDKEEEEDA